MADSCTAALESPAIVLNYPNNGTQLSILYTLILLSSWETVNSLFYSCC